MSESEKNVRYGLWEQNTDVAPDYVGTVPFSGGPAHLHPRQPLRRKRFESWRDENGQLWGRWEWENEPIR